MSHGVGTSGDFPFWGACVGLRGSVEISDSVGQTRHKASELAMPVMRVVMRLRVLLYFVSCCSY